MNRDERTFDQSRRTFVQRVAYATPLILTLKAEPAFASYGSGRSTQSTVFSRGRRFGEPDHSRTTNKPYTHERSVPRGRNK